MTNQLYLSCAIVSCFDGEPAPEPTPTAPTGPAAMTVPAGLGFTPEQQKFINDTVAAEKRKEQAKSQATLEKTEQTYKEMLANNQNLSTKDRTTLEEALTNVQGQLRTKENQLILEKKELEEKLTGKIKEHETRANQWESRFRDNEVLRSLQDAAISADAFRAEQIVSLLKPMTKLVEEVDSKTGKATGRYVSTVEFPDKDATTGEPILTSRTPEDAVKRMKELPEIYGNLFKSNVVSGIGSSSGVGITNSNGKIDLKNLSPAQYREIREKNPEALGLKKSHTGRRN